MEDELITLRVSRRDAGRLLKLSTDRQRKFRKGIDKFGDDFDAELGHNMVEGEKAYRQLAETIERAINE
jgi:hypothetical protein